jgi:hypothetical protein
MESLWKVDGKKTKKLKESVKKGAKAQRRVESRSTKY